MTTRVAAYTQWNSCAFRRISKCERPTRPGPTGREAIWRHLMAHPTRDDIDTLIAACKADGITVNAMTAYATRSRWRDTLRLLAEAGVKVPF